MRCPSCNAENEKEAARCGGCGIVLVKKSKRRGKGTSLDEGSPFAWPVEPVNWPCTRAYWAAIAGLIPGLGLVMGPVAIVLGLIARAHIKKEPACTTPAQATAAIIFGSAITLTNWLGLTLMVLGWPRGGS